MYAVNISLLTEKRHALVARGHARRIVLVNIGLLAEKRHVYQDAVADAQSKLDAHLEGEHFEGGSQRAKSIGPQTQSGPGTLHFYEERSRQDLRNLIKSLRFPVWSTAK